MQNELAEKFAALLAECATTGNNAELQKEAAAHALIKEAVNPAYLIGAPLLGATVGGLSGYYGTDKAKRRYRNALYGALVGGLGGLGGALAAPVVSDMLKGKGPVAGPVASKPLPNDGTTNAGRGTVQELANIGGIAGGAGAGWRASGNAYNKIVDYIYGPGASAGRGGELSRLQNEKVAPKAKGAPGKTPYADALSRLFEAHGPADAPLAASLNAPTAHPGKAPVKPVPPVNPTTHPGFVSGHPDSLKAMDTYNKALADYHNQMREWQATGQRYNAQMKQHMADRADLGPKLQAAEEILKTKSLGTDAGERARKAKVLEEMLASRGHKATGTILTDLDKHQRVKGRGIAKGVGGAAGGVAGGLATDYVGRWLKNFIAARLGNAPTPETK